MSDRSVYIITGASRGLGEALTRHLMQQGNKLVLVSRTRNEALQREAEAAGTRLVWYELDLAARSSQDTVEDLMHELLRGSDSSAAQRLRLINNAGVLEPIGPAHANSRDAMAHHLAVNLTAPMALTCAFLRHTASLPADKRVLQISSGAGRKPYAGWSTYCAAKAGLDHFTRCVKLEQDAMLHGAKVASIAPGVIDTGMQALIRESGEDSFPSRNRFMQLFETGALMKPVEAAWQLLQFLEHSGFGDEPVVDIRDWAGKA
jgi:benzil reductase ((S)-benzoin forming)